MTIDLAIIRGVRCLALVGVVVFVLSLVDVFTPAAGVDTAGRKIGRPLAVQLMLFGILYPRMAGLDSERESLYLNLCALVFLALAVSPLLKYLTWAAPLNEASSRRPETVASGLAQP